MAGHQGAILDASKQPAVAAAACRDVAVCASFCLPRPFSSSSLSSSPSFFTLRRESFLERDAVNTAALSRLPVTQHLPDQIESRSQYCWKGK